MGNLPHTPLSFYTKWQLPSLCWQSPITPTATSLMLPGITNIEYWRALLQESINVFLLAEPRKIIWPPNLVIPVPTDDLTPHNAGPSMRTVMTTNRHSWSFSLIVLPYLSTLSDSFPPTADRVQLLAESPSLLPPGMTNTEGHCSRNHFHAFLLSSPWQSKVK